LHVVAAVKTESARQICCSKTLVAQSDKVEKVRKLCQDVTEFSKSRMADRSNGIQEFAFMQDQWDSNVFHFWERYKSNVHMGRHNTTDEVVDFMSEVRHVHACHELLRSLQQDAVHESTVAAMPVM
jgi:quinol monooxygenase YgiN